LGMEASRGDATMKILTSSAGVRITAMALAAAGAVALAGCENPQPTAAPEQATAAPPPGDTALMGAPNGAAPESAPPPGTAYPPPPGYGAYPPGYGHMTGPGAPGEIVAMAPIPNPPAHGWYYGHWYGAAPEHHHHRHHVWIYGGAAAVGAGQVLRHHHPHHPHPVAVAKPAHHVARSHPAPAHPAPARPAPSHVAPTHLAPSRPQPAAPVAHHPGAAAAAAGAAATAAGASQPVKPHTTVTHRHHVDEATSAAAAGGPTNVAANATDNETGNVTGTEADRYKALESSLHDAFESVAVLNVPTNMTPGQASTVTLTLPSEFGAAVQRDAGRQGLSDAAASMNLLATLSGDGYTIVPGEAQTMALTAGQPVSFQWQVTPGTAAKGPLKVDARAQVVSAGQYLNLGDKSQGDTAMAGKVVGVGLLVLIAALILGWAFRRKPARSQTVIRRPAYDQYPPPPSNV
jgi:hypothetical protein